MSVTSRHTEPKTWRAGSSFLGVSCLFVLRSGHVGQSAALKRSTATVFLSYCELAVSSLATSR